MGIRSDGLARLHRARYNFEGESAVTLQHAEELGYVTNHSTQVADIFHEYHQGFIRYLPEDISVDQPNAVT